MHHCKKGQGTIEYLVIIAVVVVLSLVVVGVIISTTGDSTNQINNSQSQIKLTTAPISIIETALGINTDANGIITIQNNTGETITNFKINLSGKDHNFNTTLSIGETKNLKLNDIETPCTSGQKTTNQNLTINYTNSLGLTKTINYGLISLTCVETINPNGNSETQESNQTNEDDEEP